MGYNWSTMPLSLMGYVWAEWARVRTGHVCLGPLRAKRAWVRTGQPKLGLIWAMYGLSGPWVRTVQP